MANKRCYPAKPAGRSVIEMARERIAHTFDLFDSVIVMFSGGKDSTVCLQLTLDEARRRDQLPLEVVFFDEEAIPYQTEAYCRRVSQWPDVKFRWLSVPIKHANACSTVEPWWYPWDPDQPEKWCRPKPPESEDIEFIKGLTVFDVNGYLFPVADYGRLAVVMGIRADESLTRRGAVSARAEDNYIIKDKQDSTMSYTPGELRKMGFDLRVHSKHHVFKVYPIYDWTTQDVWTAPKRFEWDHNEAYDVLAKAGLPPHSQRCAPPFGTEPMQGLWTFRTCFPELWDKMHNRVAGAATAARYSRTKLYAFSEKITKPDGITWPAFVTHLIGKHDEGQQYHLAYQIKKFIRKHYNETDQPILATVAHPYTGLSWTWIAQLAMRGDPKSRKRPAFNARDTDRGREQYAEALTRPEEQVDATAG